jgi:hypothetical protein
MLYILKCLLLPENKWPNILVKEIIKHNIGLFKHWNELSKEYGCRFEVSQCIGKDWKGEVENLIVRLEKAKRNQWALRALQSPHYTLHSQT